MRRLLLALLFFHAFVHGLGFVKGCSLGEVGQLSEPISRVGGVAWLVAGLLVMAGAFAVFASPRRGWWLGLAAAVVSEAVITTSWSDAWAGTFGNLLLVAWSLYGLAAYGPWSYRAAYRRDVRRLLALGGKVPGAVVTEAELAPLPEPVQRYLRRVHVVGRPRVRNFRARWKGEIRSGPDAPWMAFTAEQHNFYAQSPSDPGAALLPARLFFMDAVMKGLPVDVLHAFIGPAATMRVKLLSLFRMANAAGPAMNRAETVTLFNDLTILAPAELVDPTIRWTAVDDHTTRATFTRGAETISAELHVNAVGELVDFVSDDRLVIGPDGVGTPMRWSTPVRDYRPYGEVQLASAGQGVWHAPARHYTYIRLELLEIVYNLGG